MHLEPIHTLKIHEKFLLVSNTKSNLHSEIAINKKRERWLTNFKKQAKRVFQNSKIGLWSNQLHKIQCHYGNTIESYFLFHRHLTILNLVIGVAVYLAALIPQLVNTGWCTVLG